MRRAFVLLGALLMIGAALPSVAAHWDDTTNGPDCGNTNFDDQDAVAPGPPSGVDTCGVAGRVVGYAGSAMVNGQGNLVAAEGQIHCDMEFLGPGWSQAPSNEVEIEEVSTPSGQQPDNTWDDGGLGGACHTSRYTISNFNTDGCGEVADHKATRANPVGALPVFLGAGCDIGSIAGGQANPTSPHDATVCIANRALEGNADQSPTCTGAATSSNNGYANCRQDGAADLIAFGYATPTSGPPVPTKIRTQQVVGGGLDCSPTEGSTYLFVFRATDHRTTPPTVSGPATHVWTVDGTGSSLDTVVGGGTGAAATSN